MQDSRGNESQIQNSRKQKRAETIYKLRQQGHAYQYIAEYMGQHLQTAMQKYMRDPKYPSDGST